jgi:Flp pilus assembly protein TadG
MLRRSIAHWQGSVIRMMRLSPVQVARKRQKKATRDAQAPKGARHGLRRLIRDDSAVAALEFAMVAPIFLLLIMGVLENGLTLWQQSVLDNATRDAARLIQTGQQQGGGSSFSTRLCSEITGLMTCSALQYRAQTASTFAVISPSISTNSSGVATGFTAYPTGLSNTGLTTGKDTVIQVIYTRTYIVPWLGQVMSGSKDYEQLVATAAFQIEP